MTFPKLSFIFELCLLVIVSLFPQFWFHQYYHFRIYLCLVFMVYIGFMIRHFGYSRRQLGLVSANFPASLYQLLPLTLLAIGLIVFTKIFFPTLLNFGVHYDTYSQVFLRLFVYVVISVPVQEIIFRSYIISRLEQFFLSSPLVILLSSLFFSALHWPFGSFLFAFGSFLLGLLFALNFLRFRNLYSLLVIHSLIGVALTLLVVQVG